MRRELKRSLGPAFGGVVLLALGCGHGGPSGSTGRDYTVRAQVVQTPDPSKPAGGLYIFHEALDDWVGRSGQVEGMDSMAMPFPVAPGAELKGIQANDKVTVTLHVDWEAERPVEITQVRKLSPATRLVFRAAKPH